MRQQSLCGSLFTGLGENMATNQTVVVEDGVGPAAGLPRRGAGHKRVDCSNDDVLPGLIDIHVHRSFAASES